jgi:hypothetical protein
MGAPKNELHQSLSGPPMFFHMETRVIVLAGQLAEVNA